MRKELIIFGCGGFSKAVTEVALSCGPVEISYIEDSFNTPRGEFLGKPVLDRIPSDYQGNFFIAIGDNFAREKKFHEFKKKNPKATAISLIHPNSYVSSSAQIGEGVLIMQFSSIGASCRIDQGVIVFTSVIEHESKIGGFSSIAPGVAIGGGVSVGFRSAILIGAKIKHNVVIGNDSVIGGSSLLLSDSIDNSIYFGVPAKFIRNRNPGDTYF